MGAPAGESRLPCRVRSRGFEDSCQNHACRAQGARRAAPLCACRHGQLQRQYGEALYGYRIVHLPPVIGADASALFNEITGYSSPYEWKAFGVAPTDLKQKLFGLIDREKAACAEGKPAHIIAKMNSLSNQEMIDKLYEASQAGVRIELIVRGVCCLRPGVPGLSENIRVISIVDRFLEHSRIMYFRNGGEEELFLSSADWMTRNLTRRIELMCPVFDARLRKHADERAALNLDDN